MLITWWNITSTARLIKEARENKLTIIVRSKIMFKTLRDVYRKVKRLWNDLANISWDIAVYRIDTFSPNEIEKLNKLLKNGESIIYNALHNPEDIIELK